MIPTIRVCRRSAPETPGSSQTRQPTANADPIPGHSLPPPRAVARTVRGLLLCSYTLRFRHTNMRVAVARSTSGWRVWQAPDRAHHHHCRGARSSRHPGVKNRSSSATPAGAAFLTPGTPSPAQKQPFAPDLRTSGPARPKIISDNARGPLDKPFHMRTTPVEAPASHSESAPSAIRESAGFLPGAPNGSW